MVNGAEEPFNTFLEIRRWQHSAQFSQCRQDAGAEDDDAPRPSPAISEYRPLHIGPLLICFPIGRNSLHDAGIDAECATDFQDAHATLVEAYGCAFLADR